MTNLVLLAVYLTTNAGATTVQMDSGTGIEATLVEMQVTRTFVLGTKRPRKVHHEVKEPLTNYFIASGFRNVRLIAEMESAKASVASATTETPK